LSLAELEQRFDAELPQPRLVGRPSEALLGAGRRWAEAVWTAATATGPLSLGGDDIERGVDTGRHPVFICGVHRSGTTLVRDLLDDHPALSILPAEGTFLTDLQPKLDRLSQHEALPYMGREWLRRLVNPINQRPYWLLGRSEHQQSPYANFARALMAWWPVAADRFGGVTSSWPLVAVALAYAHVTGRLAASACRHWGEKTPANERHLDRLESEFPESRVIQVVRHPSAVYASRRTMEQRSSGSFRNANQVLRDLDVSYRTAAERSRRRPPERFLLIRYEDLIENPDDTVSRVARFLDIDPLPVLMQPTVAGLPAASNSSFALEAVPEGIRTDIDRERAGDLPRSERDRLAAVVGAAAASVGYDLAPVAAWRARLLRLTTRMH
jgi:hypothetical protein